VRELIGVGARRWTAGGPTGRSCRKDPAAESTTAPFFKMRMWTVPGAH
jgi:hypothetical protein